MLDFITKVCYYRQTIHRGLFSARGWDVPYNGGLMKHLKLMKRPQSGAFLQAILDDTDLTGAGQGLDGS